MNKYMKTSLFIILGGVIAIGAGTFFMVTGRQQVARDTEPATATVTDYVVDTSYDSATETDDTFYYPVMSYEADGEQVESQYNQGSDKQKYQIGQTVEIQYNPDDVSEYIIVEDTKKIQSGTIWEIPLGIVLLAIGLGRIIVPVILASREQKAS